MEVAYSKAVGQGYLASLLGAHAGFLKEGVKLRSIGNKRGGGSSFGLNVKKPMNIVVQKGGGHTPGPLMR